MPLNPQKCCILSAFKHISICERVAMLLGYVHVWMRLINVNAPKPLEMLHSGCVRMRQVVLITNTKHTSKIGKMVTWEI